MQIVIDIDDDLYTRLFDNGEEYVADMRRACVAIRKGVILPKGHGRLGDLSKIYVELNEAQIEGTEEYKGLGEAKQMICDAPTIIEAESEDTKNASSTDNRIK